MSHVILVGGSHTMLELCSEAELEVLAVIDDPGDEAAAAAILKAHPRAPLVLGFGPPEWRKKMVEQFQRAGRVFTGVVHPEAKISPACEIGVGAVIQFGCFVAAGGRVGPFSFLDVGAAIMEDAAVSGYCCLEPRAVV